MRECDHLTSRLGKFDTKMSKILVRISTILALAALCAFAIKAESKLNAAEQSSNVYIPTCTTNGVMKDTFWNFNNCTACGFNCLVKGGENVYNKVAATLTKALVDPVIMTTFFFNGVQVTNSTSVMTASYEADKYYAVETWAYVPRHVFPGVFKVTFQVTPKGEPDNRVACASCEFRIP